MKTHTLKIWPQYFQEVTFGLKTAQLRRNDRNFKVGDILILREWCPERKVYLGHETRVKVTDLIEKCEGLQRGFCILSIKLIPGQLTVWRPEIVGRKILARAR